MSGVLVSGATTPLGVRLVARLLERDGPVLAVGFEDERTAGALLPPGATYVRVDLTRPRHVRRLLYGPVRDLGVTAVAHLAQHRDAAVEGARVHRLNVDATRLMLRLAEEHPTLERFVHLSSAFVYRNRTDQADVLREDAPLNLSPGAPQWVRDRVEADVTVCSRMGLCDTRIVVLRAAEILAPDMGSQMWSYLEGRVCLRPAGFDPMIELLSLDDAVAALVLALSRPVLGVFNVPGADVLPLSRAIRLWGRDQLPLPGPVVAAAYRARAAWRPGFRYDLNKSRFHFNAVLDGTRAAAVLGYRPSHPVAWPHAEAAATPQGAGAADAGGPPVAAR